MGGSGRKAGDRGAGGHPSRAPGFRFAAAFALLALFAGAAPGQSVNVQGRVTDPAGTAVHRAEVALVDDHGRARQRATTDGAGRFVFGGVAAGTYVLRANADGFKAENLTFTVTPGKPVEIDVRLTIATDRQTITVTADVAGGGVLAPDPAQRVLVRAETLDANPGRPGAPVSIPGIPIETASGGIKAPQYFAPGVAGDHGEPIAQYILVGGYLLPNNLSANAHGNGYADPNILIPFAIESVQTDGGAFNVREGNHAQNLAVTYGLRSQVQPFLTLTGDYRDVDVVAGWSPAADPHSWITLEAAYGNGFLDRLEHRGQYKFNAFRTITLGQHELTIGGIGYFGTSYIPGLVPLGVPHLQDTLDPRQKDQTHTALVAVNDVWQAGASRQLQLSGFFRTYNLALCSNFGDGLIRQSEFRTVAGGNALYTDKLADWLTVLAGVDYQRDAPRRDDLDRYSSTDPARYGPFDRVSANTLAIGDLAPYASIDGKLTKYLGYDVGWRRDQVRFDNQDLLTPAHSFKRWVGFNNPKATISLLPNKIPWLPNLSASWGEAFFTLDPRIGIGSAPGSLVSRSHSYQLVVRKEFRGYDVRVTLGHATTQASLAKIDPDTGLQEDEGPGRLRYVTLAARHSFGFGTLQASCSKADARDLSDGAPTPEAPRLIVDLLGTLERLPFHLRARGEFEYVGAKPLGDGFAGVANTEVRGAVLRSFRQGRMDLAANFLIARGYTGQTTEILSLPDETGPPFERVVGVRLRSYVSISYTYHFRAGRVP